jgi:hypothetical protein
MKVREYELAGARLSVASVQAILHESMAAPTMMYISGIIVPVWSVQHATLAEILHIRSSCVGALEVRIPCHFIKSQELRLAAPSNRYHTSIKPGALLVVFAITSDTFLGFAD